MHRTGSPVTAVGSLQRAPRTYRCREAASTASSHSKRWNLSEPARAVREFKRVLRPGGVLVGSVPSDYFDALAERVYGPNTYHVTRFTHGGLEALLRAHFACVRIYYSALEVVTHIGSLQDGRPATTEAATIIREQPASHVSGSFHFVATDSAAKQIDQEHENQMFFCNGMVELDEIKVMPLRRLVEANEQLVRQKDLVIRQAEELIGERDRQIHELQGRLERMEALLPPRMWKFLRSVRRVDSAQ
jgi:hypothetical protein